MNLTQIKKHVTISEGNVKLGTLPSISLPPIVTCNKKAPCCNGDCYALNGNFNFDSVKKACAKNLNTFKSDPVLFLQCVSEWIRIRKPSFFRWHVAGDIPNKTYLNQMIFLAKKHPNVKFLAFTKKYNLLKYATDVPENLSIIVSAWPGLRLPKTSLPIAFMDNGSEKRIKDVIECPGKCETCGMCWNLPKLGKNVVFKYHR